MNYKYRPSTETFFQWTINTGNYSSLSNQNGANLCLKCRKIRLAAGLRPDPLRKLVRYPWSPSRYWAGGLLLRGCREGEGPTSKGEGGRGGKKGRKGREREFPQSQGEWNTHWSTCRLCDVIFYKPFPL